MLLDFCGILKNIETFRLKYFDRFMLLIRCGLMSFDRWRRRQSIHYLCPQLTYDAVGK
jgi:hypothetical protein